MGIDDGEFESTREYLEWYFGDLLEEVSAESPVSRARLGATLVKLHVSAERRRAFLVERCARTHQSSEEQILWLTDPLWETLAGPHDISPLEVEAAVTVHRRMAAAIEGSTHAPRPETKPFVLLSIRSPSGSDPTT
jgi:hypothetical protein